MCNRISDTKLTGWLPSNHEFAYTQLPRTCWRPWGRQVRRWWARCSRAWTRSPATLPPLKTVRLAAAASLFGCLSELDCNGCLNMFAVAQSPLPCIVIAKSCIPVPVGLPCRCTEFAPDFSCLHWCVDMAEDLAEARRGAEAALGAAVRSLGPEHVLDTLPLRLQEVLLYAKCPADIVIYLSV